MSRPSLPAICAVLFGSALTACSPIPPAPFGLRAEDGTVHALKPDARPEAGFEGSVGGGGRAAVLFTLEAGIAAGGERPALEVQYELSGTARLDLFSDASRERPLESVELPRGPGRLRWILPLPRGARLTAFRFTALPSGQEAKAADSVLKILALELRQAQFGFARLPEGARFSRGTSLVRDSGTPGETLRVEHPFGPADSPVIRVESERTRLRVSAGSGSTAVLERSPEGAFLLPLAALGGYGPVSVESERPDAIRSVAVLPGSETSGPLPLDLAVLLALPAPDNPSPPYALHRWSVFPECLVFDFRDYGTQDAYLKRLAFFVEKEGFRGRLAGDREIAGLHGWNAHDYRAEDLASFFDKAERASFPLSAPELELRGILEREGILLREGGRIKPGRGVFISISRESTSYLRDLFLNHEASHALFFLDGAYRDLARSLWKAQGAEARRFWNVFLSNRDYDPTDAYLSYNELQAYLVQQAPSRLESWLKDVAFARLAKSYPDRAAGILSDLEAALPEFKAAAETLDSYLRTSYGFRGGSFEGVRFE